MINKSILIGRLTKDPEVKYTQSNLAVCSFTIAVNRAFKKENEEREADFIQCVAWRNQAENLAKFTKKGSQIAVEGRIQTRNYEGQDGKKIYVTEVVADSIVFLTFKNEETKPENYRQPTIGEDYNRSNSGIEINDDDLPF